MFSSSLCACFTVNEGFIFTVDTKKASKKHNNTLEFTIQTSPYALPWDDYNYHIDCNNDGIYEEVNQTKAYTCKYKNAGVYSIRIGGSYPAFLFKDASKYLTGSVKNPPEYKDSSKLISIDHWGTQKWSTMEYGFANCSNLVGMANDLPNLSQVYTMQSLFSGATQFNAPLNDWNMSTVTNISTMFEKASSFNQVLNAWDVSSVTDMSGLFREAKLFNRPLNLWDVRKVKTMFGLFAYAETFNQDINDWNTSAVTKMGALFRDATEFNQPLNRWDVSSVTDMFIMFHSATHFNQALNHWDISSVTNMRAMFKNTKMFNQSLGEWKLFPSQDMIDFIEGSNISSKNYSSTLKGWATNSHVLPKNVSFKVDAFYTKETQEYRDILTSAPNHWTIQDKGIEIK